MTSPLIAVVAYHLDPGRVSQWDDGAMAVPDTYIRALKRAGARPAILTGPDRDPPEGILEPFDGLVLAGGGDVEPSRYGAADRHPEVYGVDLERDQLEIDLALAADRLGLPTLAICRGLQVMNVAFGGTLHQHLSEGSGAEPHRGPSGGWVSHQVKVAESSRLGAASGRTVLECRSGHHQGIDDLAAGLVPVAWTGDGLIEAAEREEGWFVGVQWHPEQTADQDPSQQSLFDALAVQARAGG